MQLVIEKELKLGVWGSVYLVRSAADRHRYVYRTYQGSGEVYRAMVGIHCPYLPQIYDVWEEDGHVCILEEYIQGDSLAFLLEGSALSEKDARQIVIQVCQGLLVLHSMGAVHRDIKPENIILRGSDAVLIDFGASRVCKEDSATDTRIMGTTGYAAPEQYGFAQTDARADIYSVGILLNEMLTRQHPSKQLARGKYRPIIEKCTQINADRRYSSVNELIKAMNAPHSGKAGKLIIPILAVLVIGAILLRQPVPKQQELPEETESIILLDKPTWSDSFPEIVTFPREEFHAMQEPWDGPSEEGYGTHFKCDMDGDGVMENYIFAVDYVNSPHEDVVYYCRSGFRSGELLERIIHPCVWRMEADGSMIVAEEFAQYLTDAQPRLWRIGDTEMPEPKAWTIPNNWPGCVQVEFAPTQDSSWMYEVHAYIGDQELTACALFIFASM